MRLAWYALDHEQPRALHAISWCPGAPDTTTYCRAGLGRRPGRARWMGLLAGPPGPSGGGLAMATRECGGEEGSECHGVGTTTTGDMDRYWCVVWRDAYGWRRTWLKRLEQRLAADRGF